MAVLSTSQDASTAPPASSRSLTPGPTFAVPLPAASGYLPSLDGLRAVSILLVLFSHFVDAKFFPGGLGVLVFFVISGFLITRLLLAEWHAKNELSIGKFYWRRFWRLYPAIMLYCVTLLVGDVLLGRPVNVWEPLSALFYFANYLYVTYELRGIHAQMPFQIFWSLSVEEHFYWIFPLVFVAVRGSPVRLARIMLWICGVCLLARILVATLLPQLLETQLIYWTELRGDSIAFGVLLAALCETARGRQFVSRLDHPAIVATALLGILVSLLWRDVWFRETFRYSIEAASVGVLVAAILFSNRYRLPQRFLNWAPVMWIGMMSYSLYVWHPLVAVVVQGLLPGSPRYAEIPLAMAASFAVAAASFYLVEAPLRSRFGRRPPAMLTTEARLPDESL